MSSSFTNSTVQLLAATLGKTAVEAPCRAIENEVLELFDGLRTSLLRYAVSLGLPVHDGEDVLQETFLALFHHLRRGRSRSNLRGWLFCVTHNLALKRRTAIQRSGKLHDGDFGLAETFSDSAPNPEQELLFSERKRRLDAILRALPERDRWCLQLRAEGLRYREIANVAGISLGSVSTSLARSLARLASVHER